MLSHADAWSTTTRSEYVSTALEGQVPKVHATILMAAEDILWVTGFPDVTTPSGVLIAPDGAPWFAHVTPDGYILTELTPPGSGPPGGG